MRTCLSCHKCHFYHGHPAWSEITPGDEPELSCDATPAHWHVDFMDETKEGLRRKLETAESCVDYTPEGTA